MNDTNYCKNNTVAGTSFKIFVPKSVGAAEAKAVERELKNQFDIVVTSPAGCDIEGRDERRGTCGGIQVVAIRKTDAGGRGGYVQDLNAVLRAIKPDNSKTRRGSIIEITTGIQVSERCDTRK